jgi:hypothetical protein
LLRLFGLEASELLQIAKGRQHRPAAVVLDLDPAPAIVGQRLTYYLSYMAAT